MRDGGCSEKLIRDTRNANVILNRLKSTSDKSAMEELACLDIVALERAMWLQKAQQSTVHSMRGQQNAVLKQVMEVQVVIQGLLKAKEKADDARRKMQNLTRRMSRLLLPWWLLVQLTLLNLLRFVRRMLFNEQLLMYYKVQLSTSILLMGKLSFCRWGWTWVQLTTLEIQRLVQYCP